MNIIETGTLDITTKRRVAAYARVSWYGETISSIQSQVVHYQQMITSNMNWTFAGVFVDYAESGTDATPRPEFNRIIDLALSGYIDLILVKSTSRFARNVLTCLEVARRLKESNVEVWFEIEQLSSLDPNCDFRFSMKATFDENYSRNTSEIIKWGNERKFRRGDFVFHRTYGYDLLDGKITIIDGEAQVVKKIFSLYNEGVKPNQIATTLNDIGHRTLKGRLFDGHKIAEILKNESYTGTKMLHKKRRVSFKDHTIIDNDGAKVMVENAIPVIISKDDFEKAKQIRALATLRHLKTLDKSALRNKSKPTEYSSFAFCSQCGSAYNKTDRYLKDGLNRGEKRCPSQNLILEHFDTMIINQINIILMNKKQFLEVLEDKIRNRPEVVEVKNNFDRAKARMQLLEEKLGEIKSNATDEFSVNLRQTIINQIDTLKEELIVIENSLLTTYNYDYYFDKMRKYLLTRDRVDSLDEIPFRELFTYCYVGDRNDLKFIIAPSIEYNKIDKDDETILNGITKYYIVKTLYSAKHGVIIV